MEAPCGQKMKNSQFTQRTKRYVNTNDSVSYYVNKSNKYNPFGLLFTQEFDKGE